ncbi:Hypothetical predicted protein [Paramuricea clavata]|uniref:Uncharacterized protein n=1 Tax=Paramuricea clavata TaxID=317549 RepID=A0A7D9HRG8_PARCT|nr:Hypothetical predicted protein [Paramuricea clavata]
MASVMLAHIELQHPETHAYIKYNRNTPVVELMRETKVFQAQIYKIKKEPLRTKIISKRFKGPGGRPEKLSVCDKRALMEILPRTAQLSNMSFSSLKCPLLAIPPRSADLNPIENIFHLVSKQLEKDVLAKDISCESMDDFKQHMKATFMSHFPQERSDKTIFSMSSRIKGIICEKGERLKC